MSLSFESLFRCDETLILYVAYHPLPSKCLAAIAPPQRGGSET
jgi:hypothetical protein